MEVSFTAKTESACKHFMQIIYEDETYELEAFSKKYKTKEFELDPLLPKCSFIYRGKKYTYEEYCKYSNNIALQVNQYLGYNEGIFQLEPRIAICNQDYYKAAKFLEKAEECMQTARYYLYLSVRLFDFDCNVNWKTGYAPIFDLRCMHFKTAVVWYNNCFDYILQIVFLAFGFYKEIKNYSDDMSFEEVLGKCKYSFISNLHDKYSDNVEFNKLWQILSECRNDIKDIRTWANYSKHKGGIGFVGLKPEPLFQIHMERNGKIEKLTKKFEMITIDLDSSIPVVIEAHKKLYDCLDKVVGFIGFENAVPSINEEGLFVIPEKESYVKIALH